MFSKILIANRGEIACRIMRTAKSMGIATVAVFSDADAGGPHVLAADEAVRIGGAASADSYLCGDRIIQAALDTGAEAIHPGFGFLSENADFVDAVEAAGLAFIGPGKRAIKVMGDKIESKALAGGAGVSIVPGTAGAVSDVKAALKAATDIGFPVMVKASAGGGGKGMRVVESADDLAEGMRAAMSEAQNAFGDSRVFIEKFVVHPRHIEIQVLADTKGNAIYLGERECSIQRRHQKVIEEAPSPFISPETRAAMGAQAVELARAVDYKSAGTVEFIVGADQDFYFLEMNTRLQVEHPVTEMVYGLDLVEWMIRIAAGEALSIKQSDVKAQGWAVEARLYAEDPERGFLPSIGQLTRYHEPVGDGVRVDSGVAEGGAISMYYDPMISKLIAYAPTRLEAIDRLHLALDHYEIDGISSNRQFLAAVLENQSFRDGNITTGFIDAEFDGGFVAVPPDGDRLKPLLALGVALIAGQQAERSHGTIDTEFVTIDQQGNRAEASWSKEANGEITVVIDGRKQVIFGRTMAPVTLFDGTINEVPLAIQIKQSAHHVTLSVGSARLSIAVLPKRFAAMLDHMPIVSASSGADEISAPMPGQLTKLLVGVGDTVLAGQDVAIIEAMKMENVLKSEADGTINNIHVAEGDNLNVDDLILSLDLVAKDAS
ncbi:acetyl/propionyl/methylcrotonyl-CoA carboxylase subunit alpha [Alphaproteobacteria bacterium]|jgi:propionyl-CoA carboxylase alpha chain|nr:acetyl/propionyl/methylcrotonyl-CoA carboxylase subunit alpha [Alphaproteobacteria bacterium]